MNGGGEGQTLVCGGVVCASLPNVRADGPFACVDGRCVVPPEACELGFAHCSEIPEDGCEQQIDRISSCGACDDACPPELPACVLDGDEFRCASGCLPRAPDLCEGSCVDTQTNNLHCGACKNPCPELPNIFSRCEAGQCVPVGECYAGSADCSSEPGCEPLDTPENCGACGRDSCVAAQHTSLDCSNPDGCLPPLCNAGYANCDRSALDCETVQGASCWPEYAGTAFFDAQQLDISAATYGSDGSLFIAGSFQGSKDFDPSSAVDVNDGGLGSLFVTKLNADSTYGWTVIIEGDPPALSDLYPQISVTTAVAGAAGSLLLTGSFDGSVDFDPGPGTTSLGTTGNKQAYVLSLSGDGSLDWARSWTGFVFGQALTSAPGVIYAAGSWEGTLDLDPGPGVDPAGPSGGYLVKLSSDGNYVWGREEAGCTSLQVTDDASIWCLKAPPGSLAVFESDGSVRPGSVEFQTLEGARLQASADHLYVAGGFDKTLELNDGDAELVRVRRSYPSAGALVTVDLQGHIMSARSFPEPITDLALAPDGILAIGALGNVFWDYSDGVSKLQFSATSTADGRPLLASNQTEFAVIGRATPLSDVDPGPQVVTPPGESWFVSRFRF
jgi:hypothetical protein